jgi:hypothetical protein
MYIYICAVGAAKRDRFLIDVTQPRSVARLCFVQEICSKMLCVTKFHHPQMNPFRSAKLLENHVFTAAENSI